MWAKAEERCGVRALRVTHRMARESEATERVWERRTAALISRNPLHKKSENNRDSSCDMQRRKQHYKPWLRGKVWREAKRKRNPVSWPSPHQRRSPAGARPQEEGLVAELLDNGARSFPFVSIQVLVSIKILLPDYPQYMQISFLKLRAGFSRKNTWHSFTFILAIYHVYYYSNDVKIL